MSNPTNEKVKCLVKDVENGNALVTENDRSYKTRNFHICPTSLSVLKSLSKTPHCLAMKFAKMEDEFLGFEIQALCDAKESGSCKTGPVLAKKMKKLHDVMLGLFGKKNLLHHSVHIKTALTCSGMSPGASMTRKQLGCRTSAKRKGGAGRRTTRKKTYGGQPQYMFNAAVNRRNINPKNIDSVILSAKQLFAAIDNAGNLSAVEKENKLKDMLTQLERYEKKIVNASKSGSIKPNELSAFNISEAGLKEFMSTLKKRLGIAQTPVSTTTQPETVEQAQPAAQVQEAQPAAQVQEAQPAAQVQEAQPAAQVQEAQPAAQVQEAQPAAQVQEAQPAAQVQEEQPAAQVQEEQPAAQVQEEQPAAQVQEEQPAVQVQEAQPAVAEQEQPAVQVQEAQPAVAEEQEEEEAQPAVAEEEQPAVAEEQEEEEAQPAVAEEEQPAVAEEQEEEEAQPDVAEEEQPAVAEEQEEEQPVKQPEQLMPVTTQITNTPKEGYNELVITVKIPQNYAQTTTGNAGVTYARQIEEMTNPSNFPKLSIGKLRMPKMFQKKGGSKYTPKNVLKSRNAVLRKKTLAKRHRK